MQTKTFTFECDPKTFTFECDPKTFAFDGNPGKWQLHLNKLYVNCIHLLPSLV